MAELKPCEPCEDCGCEIIAKRFFPDYRCYCYCTHCYRVGPIEANEQKAIDAWNKRS